MNAAATTSFKIEENKDLESLLAGITTGKKILSYAKNQTIFAQGDEADAVFFIQTGRVKLTVVSFAGKEATLSVLGSQEFFGVGCLGVERQRLTSATALESMDLIRIEKSVMMQALRERPRVFDVFLSDLLSQTVSLQKDLCTQIFDPSEKRLMRVLLKLTRLGEQRQERVKVPKITHDVLATMVGTTRSRVTYFINKFKKLGFIDEGKGIFVHPSRLTHALQED